MPLEARYQPGDIRRVFGSVQNLERGAKHEIYGGVAAYPYFATNTAILLDPATDKTEPQQQTLQTIDQAMEPLKGLNTNQLQKTILIPVAEQQKILGFWPRNHRVTLHYDPNTNHATLLDSRPRYASFLYPDAEMQQSLKKGLENLYGKDKADNLTFTTKYQRVQLNDTHCGAWTSRNMLDLSGALGEKPVVLEQQVTKYHANDEKQIVTSNMNQVGYIPPKSETLTLFQRFLSFLGIQQSSQNQPTPPKEHPNTIPSSSNYADITSNLNSQGIAPKLDSNWSDDIAPVIEVTNENELEGEWEDNFDNKEEPTERTLPRL